MMKMITTIQYIYIHIDLNIIMAKVTVRGGLVLAGEGQTANPLEFGGDQKTIGKLWVHRTKLRTSQR